MIIIMKNTQTDNAIKWPQMKQKIAKLKSGENQTDIVANCIKSFSYEKPAEK